MGYTRYDHRKLAFEFRRKLKKRKVKPPPDSVCEEELGFSKSSKCDGLLGTRRKSSKQPDEGNNAKRSSFGSKISRSNCAKGKHLKLRYYIPTNVKSSNECISFNLLKIMAMFNNCVTLVAWLISYANPISSRTNSRRTNSRRSDNRGDTAMI